MLNGWRMLKMIEVMILEGRYVKMGGVKIKNVQISHGVYNLEGRVYKVRVPMTPKNGCSWTAQTTASRSTGYRSRNISSSGSARTSRGL
jgi:hypothetical protein